MEEASRLGQGATAEYQPDPGWNLHNLNIHFRNQFSQTRNLDDIEKAIRFGQLALDITPKDHPDLVRRLHDLLISFADQFSRTGDIRELEKGIQLGREALKDTSERDPDHAALLHCVGVLLGERFSRAGDDLTDLNEAIELGQRAVDATPQHHPHLSQRLHNLSASFGDRFSRTGDMKDIDEAIRLGQQALDALPEDHCDRNLGQFDLSVCFRQRFLWTGDSKDLEEAIRLGKEAIENAPEDPWEHKHCLASLGSCFRDRFSRTGELSDLKEAIRLGQEVLSALPENDPFRAECLSNLSTCFLSQYSKTGELEDLDEAIRLANLALNATPEDQPTRFKKLHNLSLCFKTRFLKTKSVENLEEAVRFGQLSLKSTPEGHPDLAECLYSLAGCFRYQFLETERFEDIEECVRLLRQSLNHDNGVPLRRIMAGVSAATSLAGLSRWTDSSVIFQESFDLLPRVSPRTSTRQDLQHILQQLSGAASLAASAFLKAGRSPLEALQILEQGRGIIAGLVIDSRSDTSLLEEKHPELYSRYTRLRDIVAMPLSGESPRHGEYSDMPGDNYASQILRRNTFVVDFDHTLQEIRQHPGFERFLLPPTEKDIRDMAIPGPIAYFNISAFSAEAFIISKAGIEALPLPGLKVVDLEDLVLLLANGGVRSRRDAKIVSSDDNFGAAGGTALEDISSGMMLVWERAIKPVLGKLGLFGDKSPEERLPRIWWIGGGLMALLPLHAVGAHSPGSTENTLSHVVSSFAPTLKSLQFARSKPWRPINKTRPKVLAVFMPTTPGIPGYLRVKDEIMEIKSAIGTRGYITALEQPGKSEVLKEFSNSTICHFACHGRADVVEPAKSALLLGKTTLEELKIEDLDTVRHPQAQIAYLSACSTAEIKLHTLVDESIHLASTFLLTGFPHVIGTLWRAHDTAAVEVAKEFYKELFQVDGEEDSSVAYGLHEAVLRLRNAGMNSPDILKWATFIHIGS